MNTTKSKLMTFPVPLNSKMRNIANKFSQSHKNSQKAREVYLNTLAVLAVDFYCQCMEIETQLKNSNCWEHIMQSLMNIADLVIKNTGKLECRYLLKGENTCYIPPEVWSDRIGYIIVEIDEQNNQANLLGFVPKIEQEILYLEQLHSLSELLTHLEELQTKKVILTVSETLTPTPLPQERGEEKDLESLKPVKLTQWLGGIFAETWEDVKNLLTEQQLAIAHFSEQVKRAKCQNLKIDLITKTIILVVNIDRENPDKIVVTLQVYPTDEDRILPEGLKLIVLAEGEIFEEITARNADQLMQCRFDAAIGDKFILEIRLGEAVIREDFEL